jgi:hypothetical protein
MGQTAVENRYRREDLLRAAHNTGHPATASLIRDWVALGLLDEPATPGRGRGRGRSSGTWAKAQAGMFLWLLSVPRRGRVRDIATLCNIPVHFWLIGVEGVPFRQVRRAMETWSARTARLPWNYQVEHSGWAAERLAGRGLSGADRARLATPLADAGFTGSLEPEWLRDALADVVGREAADTELLTLPGRFHHYALGRPVISKADDDAYVRAWDLYRAAQLAGPTEPPVARREPKHMPPSAAALACLSLTELLGCVIESDTAGTSQ